MSKLIFGCGYLGQRVAERWRDAGEQVFVVTRSGERAHQFARAGYVPIVADVLRPSTLAQLPGVDTVLYAVGYDRAAGASIKEVFVAGLTSVLGALPEQNGKLIYVSSTGVYGQSHGEWVDEDSPCEPLREGGRACLAAEQVLRDAPLGSRAIILRLAGLYGPGRVPNVADISQGHPIAAPADGFLNLIHVDDAATAVLAAEHAAPPRTYIVSDGNPVQRGGYYQEIARQLQAPAPRFVPAPADSPASARAASSKRVNAARMMAELAIQLRYPSFREGLAAILPDISPADSPQ